MDSRASGLPEHDARLVQHPILLRYLHWISAAVIVWAMLSGAIAGAMAESSPIRHQIGDFNARLTLIFIPVFCLRILTRLTGRNMEPLAASPRITRAAGAAHFALYALTGCVLATGVLCLDHAVNLLNVMIVRPIPMGAEHRSLAYMAHQWLCGLLGGLVVLHVAAVVWHTRSGRPVMQRMSIL